MAEEIVNQELDTRESVVADEPQADGQEALSSALTALTDPPTDAPEDSAQEPTEPAQEGEQDDLSQVPKSLRGRIKGAESRGYERGKREVEDQYRKDLEELTNFRLERDAKELAEKEKISQSLALRLLRAERGLAPTQEPKAEPALRKGPVAQPSAEERAQTLFEQAKTIEDVTGLNVLEIFQTDADVHQKIVSGQWDFKDVAREYGVSAQTRKHVPAPARGTGQNSIERRSIASMTDEEFARFDKLLDDHTFDARR